MKRDGSRSYFYCFTIYSPSLWLPLFDLTRPSTGHYRPTTSLRRPPSRDASIHSLIPCDFGHSLICLCVDFLCHFKGESSRSRLRDSETINTFIFSQSSVMQASGMSVAFLWICFVSVRLEIEFCFFPGDKTEGAGLVGDGLPWWPEDIHAHMSWYYRYFFLSEPSLPITDHDLTTSPARRPPCGDERSSVVGSMELTWWAMAQAWWSLELLWQWMFAFTLICLGCQCQRESSHGPDLF